MDTLSHIETIGHYPVSGGRDFGAPKHGQKQKYSEWYLKWDPSLNKHPPLLHGYANPTWSSIINQIKLFDHPDFEPEPEIKEAIGWAMGQITLQLRELSVFTEEIKLFDVEWNFQATSGKFTQEKYGNKGQALKNEAFQAECEEHYLHAAELGAEPLWKISGKREYLPMTKIDDDNMRCFEIPPTIHLQYAHRVCQLFNKKMYSKWTQLPIKVGIDITRGGFHTLMKRLEDNFLWKYTGDVRKWDKYFRTYLRLMCRDLRINLIHPKYSQTEAQRIADKLFYVYRVATNACVVTPWLQVLRLKGSMLSGDNNTTADNSLGHYGINIGMVKFFIPKVRSLSQILNNFDPNLYADDHINALKARYGFLRFFEIRSKFYEAAGFNLKKEDDKVQTTTVGLIFLGATCVRHGGYFAPKYNLDRIWSSLVYKGNTIPIDHYFMKVRSLLILSTFNGKKEFDRIHSLCVAIRDLWNSKYSGRITKRSRQDLDTFDIPGVPDDFVPDFDFSVRWWLGYDVDRGLASHYSWRVD